MSTDWIRRNSVHLRSLDTQSVTSEFLLDDSFLETFHQMITQFIKHIKSLSKKMIFMTKKFFINQKMSNMLKMLKVVIFDAENFKDGVKMIKLTKCFSPNGERKLWMILKSDKMGCVVMMVREVSWNAPKSIWRGYFSRESICIFSWNASKSNILIFGSFLVFKSITCFFLEMLHFFVFVFPEIPHFPIWFWNWKNGAFQEKRT